MRAGHHGPVSICSSSAFARSRYASPRGSPLDGFIVYVAEKLEKALDSESDAMFFPSYKYDRTSCVAGNADRESPEYLATEE